MVDFGVIDRLTQGPAFQPGGANRAPSVGGVEQAEYVSRLRQSLTEADTFMTSYELVTARLLRKFVGSNFGNAEDKARPINNLYLSATTLVPLIVMANPLSDITTEIAELRPVAWMLGEALNRLYDEIDYCDTIRRATFRAIFGLSVLRCGLSEGGVGVRDGEGFLHDSGQPFVEEMGAERFRFDPRATAWDRMRWAGHRYTMPAEYFRDSGLYDKTEYATENVTPYDTKSAMNIGAKVGDADPYEDTISLVDIWLPEGNPIGQDQSVIVTLCTGNDTPIIHRIAEWEGPERGPYERFSITPVIDSIIPLPPANLWERMDDLINAVACKLERQTSRMKDITLFDRAVDPREVEAVRISADGDMVPTSDPTRYAQITFGGANKDLQGTLQLLRSQYSEIARNIDQMGGISTSGDPTATEVATLQANANVTVEDMIRSIHRPVERCGRKMLWYLFTDPNINLPMTNIDPEGNEIPRQFTAEDIEGDFLDYNFKHKLYSMQRLTAEKELSNWMTLLNQVILPLIPLAQMEGSTLAVTEIVEKSAKLMQLDEIGRIWQAMEPGLDTMMGGQPAPVAPPRGAQQKLLVGGGGRQPQNNVNTNIGGEPDRRQPRAPIQAQPLGAGA